MVTLPPCSYCGGRGAITRDHVIPKCRGGRVTVPACHGCNGSKGSEDMEPWFRRQPFFDEGRLREVRAALAADYRASRPPRERGRIGFADAVGCYCSLEGTDGQPEPLIQILGNPYLNRRAARDLAKRLMRFAETGEVE